MRKSNTRPYPKGETVLSPVDSSSAQQAKDEGAFPVATQIPSSQHNEDPGQKRSILIPIGILLIIIGMSLWILNIEGLVAGSWSAIVQVIFTALGILLALLQLGLQTNTGKQSLHGQVKHTTEVEGVDLGADGYQSALIVKVKKPLQGTSINLYHGFDNPCSQPDIASIVVGYKIDGHHVPVAIFPSLEPGKYTVCDDAQQHLARITLYPGLPVVVDWR